MNIIRKSVGCTVTAAVGMQVMLTAQLLMFSTSLAITSLNGTRVSESGQISPVFQEQGDSPDMGDREGVPPSAGSGSR